MGKLWWWCSCLIILRLGNKPFHESIMNDYLLTSITLRRQKLNCFWQILYFVAHCHDIIFHFFFTSLIICLLSFNCILSTKKTVSFFTRKIVNLSGLLSLSSFANKKIILILSKILELKLCFFDWMENVVLSRIRILRKTSTSHTHMQNKIFYTKIIAVSMLSNVIRKCCLREKKTSQNKTRINTKITVCNLKTCLYALYTFLN